MVLAEGRPSASRLGLLETSYDSYVATLNLIDEHRVWERIPEGDPFGTREAMLEALAIGDEESARREVQDRLKRRALQRKAALQQHGGDRKSEDYQGVLAHLDRGTGKTDYLLARIERDRPDVFERVLQGEFTSAAEAGRAAGIVREKRRSVALSGDVSRIAAKLRQHYTQDQYTALLRRMLELRRENRMEQP